LEDWLAVARAIQLARGADQLAVGIGVDRALVARTILVEVIDPVGPGRQALVDP